MNLKAKSRLRNLYYSAFVFYRARCGGLAKNPINNKELLKISNKQKERYMKKYCDLVGFSDDYYKLLVKY